MKLVIDIDEEDYKIMKHNIAINNPLCPLSQEEVVAKIASGIPLPKRHGRLMTDYQKYINALRKCAKEHENDRTLTGHVIVSNLCQDTANLLEKINQEFILDKIRAETRKELLLAFISGLISNKEECEKALAYIKEIMREEEE